MSSDGDININVMFVLGGAWRGIEINRFSES